MSKIKVKGFSLELEDETSDRLKDICLSGQRMATRQIRMILEMTEIITENIKTDEPIHKETILMLIQGYSRQALLDLAENKRLLEKI